MPIKKAIIIGSGIGGLATAIRLTVQGFNVIVYEKNSYPGGKLSAFKLNGYSFDAGPSLFTQPQNIEDLFTLAKEPIQDYFNYSAIKISCKYFFENGKIVNAPTDANLFAQELKEQLNEPPENVRAYLQTAEKIYNNIGSIFLNHSIHKMETWFNIRFWKALKTLKWRYLFNSLHLHNTRKFISPEAVQIFDRFATYNGSNPYKAPSMLSLIPHLEQNQGVFYPKGGMISITNALYNLALKKGVKFYFNTAVQSILNNQGKVTGVEVNGTEVPANVVVSNGDIYFTYKNLLQNTKLANKVLKQERSSSAIIFYWGIKKSFPQLQLHNIFFSKDYQQEFNNIFEEKIISNDPTVYINITAKIEREQAPVGNENWFVMVNVPPNSGQDWDRLKTVVRSKVIQKLTLILGEDIEALIAVEHTLDPITIETQTASYMGSLYGTSSNSRLAAFFRQPNFSKTIRNLYFCGGSVHPGGGIPLCLKSAEIVAGLIKKNYKNLSH